MAIAGDHGGQYQLALQDDGNLCVYYLDNSRVKHIKWATGTNHGDQGMPYTLEVQDSDGNVVLSSGRLGVLWSTGTEVFSEHPSFCIQSDGNLVQYDGQRPVWERSHGWASALHESTTSTLKDDCHVRNPRHPGGCSDGYVCCRTSQGYLCLHEDECHRQGDQESNTLIPSASDENAVSIRSVGQEEVV